MDRKKRLQYPHTPNEAAMNCKIRREEPCIMKKTTQNNKDVIFISFDGQVHLNLRDEMTSETLETQALQLNKK